MDLQFPRWVRPGLLVFLFSFALIFLGINRFDLRESTEPREAGIAADMLQHSQYLVPTLNGRPFLEKPPLSYWLQAASINTFGYEAFAPRLPSALAGIAIVCLFIFFFRRSENKAPLILLSGILLITMQSFWSYTRTAGQDMLLALGVSMALLAFYFVRENESKGAWWLYALGIAVATMTKGVIGLAVPGVVVFTFLLLETFYLNKRFVFMDWLLPALFALIGLLPLLGWLWMLYSSSGMELVKEVMWTNSVGRFQGEYAYGSHSEPFYFYFRKLPETYQPWSFLVYAAAIYAVKALRKNKRVVFFLCWFIAPYILLSMSSGKRPSYLLMLYPATAALLAQVAVLWLAAADNKTKLVKWLLAFEAGLFSLAVVFLVLRLVKLHAPAIAAVVLLMGLPLLWLLWRSLRSQKLGEFTLYSAAVILLTYSSFFAFVVPHDDQKQSAKLVISKLNEFAQNGRPIALYRPAERMEGAVSFYIQHRIPVFNSLPELKAALSAQPSLVVLTSEEKEIDLAEYKNEAQMKYSSRQYHYISARE